MATDERVRVGLVGLGRIGRFYAANLSGRIPGARLVRVVDAAEGVARENSGRLGAVEWSTRFDDLLEDPDVEAVVIASPTPLHAEMAEAAASAGKHVVTEPDHPYMATWWPPGHIIGYEHTLVHTVNDLLDVIVAGKSPAPTFEDGHRCQAVLDAVERRVESREWARPKTFEPKED